MNIPVVRVYQRGDSHAVRRICCETALYGQPIDSVFGDREFVADALVWYYTEFEPESLFVAQVDGRVVGYLTGCMDTTRFESFFVQRVIPRLLVHSLKSGHWFRRTFWSLVCADLKAMRRWVPIRKGVIAAYPAHCHLNLEGEFRHAGAGSALLAAFLERLKALKVSGIHIATATDTGKSFFTKSEFSVLARYRAPVLGRLEGRETWVMGRLLRA